MQCPDYTSDSFQQSRARLVNENTTEEQAIQCLRDIWKETNNAEKALWQHQLDNDEAETAARRQQERDEQEQWNAAEVLEFETAQREEMKKNKWKYTPIPDKDVPFEDSTIACSFALRKLEKGLYVELWYFTNDGLDDSLRTASTIDDEAMAMVHRADGTTSWIPAASARDARRVIDDKDISFEDFCQAARRMVTAMEEARWPEERVVMMAGLWGNLQMHEFRKSRDPLDQRTLLVYQAEQRRRWHVALTSPQGGYNLSRINEELMQKTRLRVHWDDNKRKEDERDLRYRTVRPFHILPSKLPLMIFLTYSTQKSHSYPATTTNTCSTLHPMHAHHCRSQCVRLAVTNARTCCFQCTRPAVTNACTLLFPTHAPRRFQCAHPAVSNACIPPLPMRAPCCFQCTHPAVSNAHTPLFPMHASRCYQCAQPCCYQRTHIAVSNARYS
jgi:hypothetical protein